MPHVPAFFDEMKTATGQVRPVYTLFADWLMRQPPGLIENARRQAELLFHRFGITFNVYGESAGKERLIPFDLIPRAISSSDWNHLEKGLRQRVTALNAFLHDIYHDQLIIRHGVVPAEAVMSNAGFRPEMVGINLPHHLYAHISGIDIIRHGDGEFYVLEDNLRTPSGVSYVLENRRMMMRLFPDLFQRQAVAPVEHYPAMLLETLKSLSYHPEPTVAVLTPGHYNSSYFEHAFLAQQMGVELVEGADLFVDDNKVFMRTTTGPQQVDVIYRRLDDDFLDPLSFRPDSMLGVPGLMSAYRSGNVQLANAVGTGVADDKAMYTYVPDMIRFYLSEEPILKNVPTWRLSRPDELSHVLAHLPELVVKEVAGSGGYGMLVGPTASRQEIEEFRARILARPENYIAQPTLALSTCPTFVESGVAPRHIDLRPFILCGEEIRIIPGGLTRVALKEGSLVVNSSQGGGTKDTWVVEDGAC